MLRKERIKFNDNIPDNDLLRLYLNNRYSEHNQYVKLQKQKKIQENKVADAKVKRMLKILDDAQIKGHSEKQKHRKGYINLKLN